MTVEDELKRLRVMAEALEGMPPDTVERMMLYLARLFARKNCHGRPMVRGDIQ